MGASRSYKIEDYALKRSPELLIETYIRVRVPRKALLEMRPGELSAAILACAPNSFNFSVALSSKA